MKSSAPSRLPLCWSEKMMNFELWMSSSISPSASSCSWARLYAASSAAETVLRALVISFGMLPSFITILRALTPASAAEALIWDFFDIEKILRGFAVKGSDQDARSVELAKAQFAWPSQGVKRAFDVEKAGG